MELLSRMNELSDHLCVVLVAPRNPLNIGAAARAMSNFGFSLLRIVNAYDVAYAEARSAVKAAHVLAQSQQYATVADAVADCTLVVGTASLGNRALALPVRRLETAGHQILTEIAQQGKVALLFGSEKFGLSNDDLSHCHALCRIPTRTEHQSMNLGQSVAVCLYELIRSEAEEAREPMEIRPADAENVERATELLLEALRLSGYIKEPTSDSSELKLRRLLRRLRISHQDAPVIQG